MGSGIAAHLANLGFEVDLLDLNRASTEAALERAKKLRPPHFYSAGAIGRIRIGGIEEDLERVREADWVCEAIVEKLDLKRELYEKLIPLLRPDALISTNTSGLELRLLTEGFPESFQRSFVGTHFFNPPRYLKLLELIPTEKTDPAILKKFVDLLEDEVGRRVVIAKDTPGFIANRFGMWAMIHAIHVTEKLGLTVEQVDAVTGPFLGRPRTASFRLNDLVGIDIMADIAANLYDRCPHDPQRELLQLPRSMQFLMEKGWIGQKTNQGYYRKEGKELLALDLLTHSYRNSLAADFPVVSENAKKPLGERIRAALASPCEAGEFLRNHLVPVLRYAVAIQDEISHSVQDFDRVMMWGFGWEMGPFAMIDAIGAENLGLSNTQKFFEDGMMRRTDGSRIPVVSEPQYRTIKDFPVLSVHDGWNLRDLGDGVSAIALTTKMGVITPALVDNLSAWLQSNDGPAVLCSEAKAFSVGFDLNYFLERIEAQDWHSIDASLKALQDLTILLGERQIVAAIHGYCLGAGFEIASACPVVLAHGESNIGLPEARVGLIPGGAGTCRMRLRFQTSAKDLCDGALRMTNGFVASSAAEAQGIGYLRRTDQLLNHPDRLIHDAKKLAQNIQVEANPVWLNVEGPVGGMIDRAQHEQVAAGTLTQHDCLIGDRIKQVFTKPMNFEEALIRERQEFVLLTQNAMTTARIKHMLETGKPLRN